MKVNFEPLYEHIGYLFFALTAKERQLSQGDLMKLTELIEKNWKPVTNGDPVLDMHLAECIHAGIRYAVQNGMSPDHAFKSFMDYFRIHSLPFSKTLKERILALSLQIMQEFPSDQRGSRMQFEMEKRLAQG